MRDFRELERMFGFDDKIGKSPSGPAPPSKAAVVVKSPNAIKVDKWCIRRGGDLMESNEVIKHLLSEIYESDEDSMNAAADFNAAAFESKCELNENCTDGRRWMYMRELLETPAYKSLRKSTVMRSCAAELAATHFVRGFHSYVTIKGDEKPQLTNNPMPPGEGNSDQDEDSPEPEMVDPIPGSDSGQDEDSPGPDGDFPVPGSDELDIDAIDEAGKAIQEAEKEIEEHEESANALGYGKSSGAGSTVSLDKLAEYHKYIKGSKDLRRIIELAGRFRRLAMANQRKKTKKGREEVTGIRLDGEISQLMSSEILRLADPHMEMDLIRKLVSKTALCRDFSSNETVGKGPIVVAIDESGSMRGDPSFKAKALALAFAWVAQHQKRWCSMVAFSGEGQQRTITLPPKGWKAPELFNWMESVFGGYTHIPLLEMDDIYKVAGAPKGKTDLVILTDAICKFDHYVIEGFNDWKSRADARVYSIVIDESYSDDYSDQNSCSMEQVSDEVFHMDSLDVDKPAISRLLSI